MNTVARFIARFIATFGVTFIVIYLALALSIYWAASHRKPAAPVGGKMVVPQALFNGVVK
jgi:preprotein translocase subunit SecG